MTTPVLDASFRKSLGARPLQGDSFRKKSTSGLWSELDTPQFVRWSRHELRAYEALVLCSMLLGATVSHSIALKATPVLRTVECTNYILDNNIYPIN